MMRISTSPRRPKNYLQSEPDEVVVEVIPDPERAKLQEFGRGLAEMAMTVKTMRGVRRGIVERAYAKELDRLERERYG